ncbi:hypothetical protein C1645_753323 [Glomus cerebriforme]|uniref:Uncharacterized protein n=1 Tax=Glomus cerebriforme TaxID=658196 RepID=A0A397TIB2_9GLOM|nr:hypothetical protein C1645_753323 [Glomus cerebriforme]
MRRQQHHLPLLHWSRNETRKLISYVNEFGENWEQVATLLGSRNALECERRYRRLIRKNNRRSHK